VDTAVLKVQLTRKLKGFNLDVDFSINHEILAVLGPSGSGKTMTLQCIAGLIRPDTGYIELNGRVLFDSQKGINLSPQMRKVGFVFQNYALFPHLNVKQNIAYGIHNLPRNEISQKVDRLLETMHIQKLGNRYPKQLSSGQQQRVAIARSLVTEPELLLLDEPFSALDTVRKEQLELELVSLQQTYKGNMLFVTHDLAQGYKIGSRMAIFDSGRIIQLDSKEQVIAAPVNRIAARLIGMKNLMDGTITRINNPNVWITIPELGKVLKVITKNGTNLTVGQHVILGIRPEHIRLTINPSENSCLLPLGRIVENVTAINCRFHTADDPVDRHHLEANLSKSEGQSLNRGQSYYVFLPPEHLSIIIV
jgi:molybdate transport system ATP-binding protein